MRELQGLLAGGDPLVYILSQEEERVLRALRAEAGEGMPLRRWTCIGGLEGLPGTEDPVRALQAVLRDGLPGVFVFCDVAPMLDRPQVVRAFREAYMAGRGRRDRVVVLLCAELNLPDSLKKEVRYLEIPPPGEEEIAGILRERPEIPPEALPEVAVALKGLTENEIRGILGRSARIPGLDGRGLMDLIFAEKQAAVRKTGFLEFSPPRWDIEGLGGQDNLKDWLNRRRRMFSREALDAGVPVPKGILIMGISGCGKSLAVKIISSLWRIPMFRLDMNLVFSGMYGTPEEAFHKALRTIEAVAPAVLWIDEIENALGLDESGQRLSSHIFSSFLTWMQEKPPLVFIAATANRIQALPAEVLRKGRFDEVFFCDLPVPVEREEIFRIHLRRNQADPRDFDLKMLQVMTEGWNGAEIEQAVVSARTEAFYEKRPFTQRDLSNVVGRIVPLSDTMEQQIKAIRSWAFSRATPASKYGRSSLHHAGTGR